MTRIRIFHANDPRDARFERPTSVTEVFAYEASDHVSSADALDQAFFRFNVGHDPAYGEPDRHAVTYHKRRNRSLSTGDVVAVDDMFFLCSSGGGWTEIAEPRIENITSDGTTPIDAQQEGAD
jgi:hypothetical protein